MAPSSTEKPLFSVRDVVYLLSFISAFFIQYYTLKTEIHDAIVEQSFNKREMTAKIAAVEFRVTGLDNKYDFLLRSQLPSPADKPKRIKIEKENEHE